MWKVVTLKTGDDILRGDICFQGSYDPIEWKVPEAADYMQKHVVSRRMGPGFDHKERVPYTKVGLWQGGYIVFRWFDEPEENEFGVISP